MLKPDTILCVYIPSIPTVRQEAETGEVRETSRPPSLTYSSKQDPIPNKVKCELQYFKVSFAPLRSISTYTYEHKDMHYTQSYKRIKKTVPYEQYSLCCA